MAFFINFAAKTEIGPDLLMNDKSFVARGILAGVCIGIGGCIYLKVGGVAGAVLFAFGLIAVISMKLNLFTGKAQYVWGVRSTGQTDQGGYVWLISILALNVAGCIVAGLLFSSGEMQEAATAVMDRRLSASPLRNGLLAVGCGFIMTLAVQNASKGRWLPLLFGIPAFILCGLPHCVADAFYIASVPQDYAARHAGALAAFYGAIVAGNFAGCNLYRSVGTSKSEPVGNETASIGPEIETNGSTK